MEIMMMQLDKGPTYLDVHFKSALSLPPIHVNLRGVKYAQYVGAFRRASTLVYNLGDKSWRMLLDLFQYLLDLN